MPGNQMIAGLLDETAALLRDQGANRFRVEAYGRAAAALRSLTSPVDEILDQRGLEGIQEALRVGEGLARAIRELIRTGHFPLLERLRGERDPITALMSVPGIGPVLADRLHHDLGIGTLEDLEMAAYDGRLDHFDRLGTKRLAGIRDALAARLSRYRHSPPAGPSSRPTVEDLLEVDREYRGRAAAGQLHRIAPRRFNPDHRAWLPILHTSRGARHYTAVYSNTPRAHRLGTTRDWVILYCDGGGGEQQFTVITARAGPLRGRRIVRGRERECADYYAGPPAPAIPSGSVPLLEILS